jgi:hypothetical protein
MGDSRRTSGVSSCSNGQGSTEAAPGWWKEVVRSGAVHPPARQGVRCLGLHVFTEFSVIGKSPRMHAVFDLATRLRTATARS